MSWYFHFLLWWVFLTFRQQVLADRNPVPSPGAVVTIEKHWFEDSMPRITLHDYGFKQNSCRGEGWDSSSMGFPGAKPQIASYAFNSAKPLGTQPVIGFDHDWHGEHTAVKKRSIHRAYKRACKQGVAWMRGRPLTPADFPAQVQHSARQHTDHQPRSSGPDPNLIQLHNKQKRTRRLRLFSWNAGGMSPARLE